MAIYARYNPKTAKVVRLRQGSAHVDGSPQESMFVSLVLGPIWQLYTAGAVEMNAKKTLRMAAKCVYSLVHGIISNTSGVGLCPKTSFPLSTELTPLLLSPPLTKPPLPGVGCLCSASATCAHKDWRSRCPSAR